MSRLELPGDARPLTQDGLLSHWPRLADHWAHFSPPLQPHAQDLARVRAASAQLGLARPRVLLLGVTPGYALLPWPAGTDFIAVDKCPRMIEKVWPATRLPQGFRAVHADWQALPLATASRDLILGDGISTVLGHWSDMQRIVAELHRVGVPGGRLVLRLFVQPDTPDSLRQLMLDLERQTLRGFQAFKLRLLMLLHETLEHGVKPRKVWQAWQSLQYLPPVQRAARHWQAGEYTTLEAYAHSDDTYWFPRMQDVRQLFAERFHIEHIACSDYELAGRCPLFVLRRLP